MNWNKILIVYAKWVLIISRFIVVALVLLALVNGKNLGPPHKLEINLNIREAEFGPVENMISPDAEYADRVQSIASYGGIRRLEIDLGDQVFTGSVVLMVIKIALVVAFLHVLLLIVKSTERKEFFSEGNVFRIRLIGFGLIGWAALDRLFHWYTNFLANKYLESDYLDSLRVSVPIVPDIFGNTFVIGLIVLIVAQAFDHGLKLEKEQELTI